MSTKIEWANPPGYKGESWNPVTGCSPISPGCDNCWARAMAYRFPGRFGGRRDPFKPATVSPCRLRTPRGWRKRRCVFVCSMGDLFHPDVPFEFIDKVFAVMALCPQHRFLVLTKRPDRMAEYLIDRDWGEAANWVTDTFLRRLDGALYLAGELVPPLPNVALGTSVEDQPRADERIPFLLQCPAAMRFVSVEPMLGPVDVHRFIRGCRCAHCEPQQLPGLDWAIVGCESGPKRRRCPPNWTEKLLDQCRTAGVPAFNKQMNRDGRVSHDPAEWPMSLRVREWPTQFFQEQSDG